MAEEEVLLADGVEMPLATLETTFMIPFVASSEVSQSCVAEGVAGRMSVKPVPWIAEIGRAHV